MVSKARFALTAHSPIARNPEKYSITLIEPPPADFARNEIPFDAHFDYDPKIVGDALRIATYNYMHGIGFDCPADQWLDANR